MQAGTDWLVDIEMQIIFTETYECKYFN